ncbi:hypothetical protein VKT23_018945 [Stygiomarasmius scandens]|uniref:CFEM domain-containing protein n=1 Tax=Marasmiellus scandens TaxID=2682957 RepID=A0ABR1IRV0_9AGAR
MRCFALFVPAALVLLASASSVSLWKRQFPSCAMPCVASADTGSCVPTDNSCLCRSESFVNSTTECIESSCSGNDLQAALSGAQQLCAAVGVTLTSTPTPTPTSESASNTTPSATISSDSSGSNDATVNSGSVFIGAIAAGLVGLVM